MIISSRPSNRAYVHTGELYSVVRGPKLRGCRDSGDQREILRTVPIFERCPALSRVKLKLRQYLYYTSQTGKENSLTFFIDHDSLLNVL